MSDLVIYRKCVLHVFNSYLFVKIFVRAKISMYIKYVFSEIGSLNSFVIIDLCFSKNLQQKLFHILYFILEIYILLFGTVIIWDIRVKQWSAVYFLKMFKSSIPHPYKLRIKQAWIIILRNLIAETLDLRKIAITDLFLKRSFNIFQHNLYKKKWFFYILFVCLFIMEEEIISFVHLWLPKGEIKLLLN